METKAVIFDFDGVFVNKFTLLSVQDICERYGISQQQFSDFAREAAVGLDTGDLAEADYFKNMIDTFDLPLTLSELQTIFYQLDEQHLQTDEAMQTLLTKLNRDYVTVLMSNVSRELAQRLANKGLYQDFQRRFLSHEAGVVKPDSQFYQHVLRELGADPGEVIFIDDNQRNVAAAQKLGISSIHHQGAQSTKEELNLLLGK